MVPRPLLFTRILTLLIGVALAFCACGGALNLADQGGGLIFGDEGAVVIGQCADVRGDWECEGAFQTDAYSIAEVTLYLDREAQPGERVPARALGKFSTTATEPGDWSRVIPWALMAFGFTAIAVWCFRMCWTWFRQRD